MFICGSCIVRLTICLLLHILYAAAVQHSSQAGVQSTMTGCGCGCGCGCGLDAAQLLLSSTIATVTQAVAGIVKLRTPSNHIRSPGFAGFAKENPDDPHKAKRP